MALETKALALFGIAGQVTSEMMRVVLTWMAMAPAFAGEMLQWEVDPADPGGFAGASASDGGRIVRVIEVPGEFLLRTEGFRIQSSLDGLSWNSYDISGLEEDRSMGVCHGDGKWFVLAGGRRFASPDGVSWTEGTATLPDENAEVPRHWLFANGWHVSAAMNLDGSTTNDPGSRLRSADGWNWIRIDQDFGEARTQAFGDGHFVVLSQSTRYRSADGGTWEEAPATGLSADPENLVYFRGRWLCTTWRWQWGMNGDFTIHLSDDACHWHPVMSLDESMRIFEHPALGRLFASRGQGFGSIGVSTAFFSSSDGFQWEYLGYHFGSSVRTWGGPHAFHDRLHFYDSVSQPLSPAAPPRFHLIRPGALESPVVSGLEYRAEWSPDLSEDSWQPLGGWRTPAAGESTMFWQQNPQDVGPRGFYRVESRALGE